MARAIPSLPHPHLARHLMTLARWLAQKAVKAQWKRQGVKAQYIDAKDLIEAGNVYLVLHQSELMKEAWAYAKPYRDRERMRLARKAVIAEIRDKEGKVNSIAPEDLRKLIAAYLETHPEEDVVREIGCS